MKTEKPPSLSEVKQKELNAEEYERFLEVRISKGAELRDVVENARLGLWMRFIVTKNHDIIISPLSKEHGYIIKDNGLQNKDVIIDNGLVRENDDMDGLIFSYQASPLTPLHHAAEKKILAFLREKGLKIPEKYEHPPYQPY